jgi:hypothetical protein
MTASPSEMDGYATIVHRKPLDELKPISAKILLACERLPFLRER